MNDPWTRKEVIGDCTLYLGDCLEVMPALGKVDACLTDPPYELSASGPGTSHSFGSSLSKFDSDAYKSIVSGFDYNALLDAIAGICQPFNLFCFCSNKQISKLMVLNELAGRATTLLAWHKTNSVPFANGVWRGDIEYIVHARAKGATFNGGALEKTKIIPHPIVIDNAHPTVKPQPVIQRLMRNASDFGQTILDPFMGSGTTLVACAKLGRKGIGIELEPDYFEIACKRVQAAYDQPDLFVAPPTPPTQEGFEL
jgi:DNA modification methylase